MRYASAATLAVLLASPALAATPAPSPFLANCAGFTITSGNPQSPGGARWRYESVDDGLRYSMEGILFIPPGRGPFPAVVVSHGKGGTPYQYSAQIAQTMVGWGMVVIGPMYAHAPAADDAGNEPLAQDGASKGNVLRAHKARDLLACVLDVDLGRIAAHGHSMGAFVTGQVLGMYPGDFRVASHTAGGVSEGPNATKAVVAARIVAPYQLHHSAADTTVSVTQDQTLASILAGSGVEHELHVAEYPDYTHAQIALDPGMLSRVRDWYIAHGVLP